MTRDDKDLHETLDLLGTLLAEVSRRVETQGAALDRLTAAVEAQKAKPGASAGAALPVDLGRVAQVTREAVRDALNPTTARLVDILETLTGTKALLRERMRAMDREQARQGRWRYQPWAVVVGLPLLLVAVLALTVPRAVAQTPLTCRATGGTWYEASAEYQAACMFLAERRN